MLQLSAIRQKLNEFVLLLLAASCLMIPMFYNGCPLFYPDSMGYIFWGQQGLPVPERVSSYSVLIKMVSLGRDLWLVIAFQSLIAAILLREIWTRLAGPSRSALFLFIMAVLGLLSPLGWTASTLMPDLFCVISNLALFLLLFPEAGKKPSLFHLALFVLSASQHMGNLMINGLLLGFYFLYFIANGKLKANLFGLLYALSGIIIAWAAIGLIHWRLSGEFFLSKSSQAFMTGRLLETGAATRFLNENPSSFPEFQKFRTKFPMSLENYLWSPESPIHSLGGLHDTLQLQAGFNRAVLSRPSQVLAFARAGLKSGIKQLFLLDLGDGLGKVGCPQLCFYPENQAEFLMSRQFSGINFEKLNAWVLAFLFLLVTFFLLFALPQGIGPELRLLGFFILSLLLANALVNGALSTPLNRYQVRVFWLVYFWLLAASYPVLNRYFSANRNSTI